MTDLHVHSTYSDDARATIHEMCARAAEIGVTQIAFTDHIDFVSSEKWTNRAFDYSRWTSEIARAREEYAGRLTILAGAEVDYEPSYHAQIEDFLGRHKFDYLLGSVHYANGVILEDHARYFPDKDQREAYVPYFEAVLAAVETGMFDAIAHMDLCKRNGVLYYGPLRVEEFHSEIEAVLRATIEKGTALEVNTSGLRQAPGETYPGIDVLRLYRELGGSRICVGSDAHRTIQLGSGIPAATSMLDQVGIAWQRPTGAPLA